ncbi:MAG: ComF family protein [Burkholderiaceae bacterium]|nr:ComF family protein [Burkholderiaceae bacterium]
MHSSQPRCPVCCLALPQLGPCPDCALLQPAYDRVVAAFDYHEPGDLLIHRLKSQRRFSMAPMLAELLAQAIRQAPLPLPKNTILLCVPASRASVLRRGFNPAAAVARSLASQLGLPYQPQLLRRAREGAKQAQLSRTERARSTQSLYACTRYVPGAHIAVVDDVLTTGSTLQGIARQLRAAGAASVCGLVVARTPYRQGTDLF